LARAISYFEKLSFCPQKARYSPLLGGKIGNNPRHINWFSWPDPVYLFSILHLLLGRFDEASEGPVLFPFVQV
jgi:hypothetical protein